MDGAYVQIAALIGASILTAVAVFQLLLFAGLPLGEYSCGGKHQGVLPPKLRIMSLPSAVLLLFIAFIYLIQAQVLSAGLTFHPAKSLVWIFTIFFGLNTLGNLASKSTKEKVVMTPLSGIAFLACLVVSIYSD